jgi:hypothetical protein
MEEITLAKMVNSVPKDCYSEEKYSPWNVHKIQCYNPLYTKFFRLDTIDYDKTSLRLKYYMNDPKHIVSVELPDEKIPCEMHIKSAPLLDPIHYLIGKYEKDKDKIIQLPQYGSTPDSCMHKVLNQNNSSYIDCFFNYLSSETLHCHGILHGIDFYGSYLAIQKHFCFNAYDDIDYLQESDYFLENNNKIYEMDDEELNKDAAITGGNSQKKRPKINIQDEHIEMDDVMDYNEDDYEDDTKNDMEVVFEKNEKDGDESSDSDGSSINYSTDNDDKDDEDEDDEDDEDEDDEDDEDDDENDEFLPLYIHNFPVQMIALEKCDGSLDELLENESLKDKEAASAMIQILFTIITYQKMFSFTHNDLHTNNILYKETSRQFLWYKYGGKLYKVPTFGRIFKIIDFGRSIYKFRGNIFCSDSFAPKGDAHGQYNTEPYLNDDKPRIEPNMSFDLCRLGCSMYDFLFDIEEPLPKNMTPFQKLINSWCLDDNGVNILYKKNGEERYPNFKLYKMISRLVHDKLPEDQLKKPFFAQFTTSKKGKDIQEMNIDTLPSYIN